MRELSVYDCGLCFESCLVCIVIVLLRPQFRNILLEAGLLLIEVVRLL